MFTAVVGHSDELDSAVAVDEVVARCLGRLGGASAKAGLLFAAIDQDHQLLVDEINRRIPGIELIGCTTEGEFSSELGFREDSVTLILFASDTVDATAGVGHGLRTDLGGACRAAVAQARAGTDKPASLCLAMPAGLTADGYSIIATLQDALGLGTPIFGALAGDQWRPEGTRQFFRTQVLEDAVPVLLLSGDLRFSYGVATGWHQVGEVGVITRAHGAVVDEIDSAPAIHFYRKYLGPAAIPTAELPLAILDAYDGIEYLRASFGTVDETSGAVTFLGTVPEGARVRLTLADRNAILSGCAESLTIAQSTFPADTAPAAALFFSCVARKVLLGTRTEEELKLIRASLGASVPVCGFYGYGEISPNAGDATGTKYHNESFVSLLIAG